MLTGHVYIATSLDGFIARPDGSLDWLMKYPTDGGENYGFDAFMDSVDGLIMGRGTYEMVHGFEGEWPYKKPVVVLSSSLSQDDVGQELEGKVRIVQATPKEIMQTLSNEGWQRVYIDGGKLIQSFLREGLIQDMILTRIPILIGKGIPLFGPLDHDIDLAHQHTEAFSSGFVISKYEVIKSNE